MSQLIPAPLRRIVRLFTTGGWVSLLAGLALLALGLRWAHSEMLVVGATLLFTLAIAVVWMLRPAALAGRRSVEPDEVIEGDEATAVITICNEGQRGSPRVTAIDHIDGRPQTLAVASIEPGDEGYQRYQVPTERRGVYTLGPLTIAHSDPFRLIRAGKGTGHLVRYRVWPRSVEVPPLPTGRVRDVEGSATPRTAGSGVTFHTLREYAPGDDRRHVHWRSTAKTGTLVVRQHVLTSEPKMVVFVDCREEAYDNADRFDDACRIAASLIRAAVRWSNPVELMVSSGTSVQIDSSGSNRERALDALAEASRSTDDEGLRQLVRMTERRHLAASIAVVTGDVRATEAEIVRAMQGRYTSFTAVQVGDLGSISALPVAASALVLTTDLDDFASQWRQRVDR